LCRRKQIVTVATLCLVVSSGSARADGLDSAYFLRFWTWNHSWAFVWTVLTVLMIVNYLLNFIVIGLPAIIWSEAPRRSVAVGLIFLTLLGQIADRIGSVVGLFLASGLAAAIGPLFPSAPRGLDSPLFGYSLMFSNVFCSGLAVGGLALWFLRKRWAVSRSVSWKIAIAAAVLTNPAWVLFAGIGRS
jgi:hypothetical protein